MPKVSVIIPLYKSTKYLKATVDSVLAQSEPDFEVILVDDCSPDTTYSFAQELAKHDQRIMVLRHDKNMGSPAFGRNTGIASARGEYVTFLDHDDSFEPTKLEEMLVAMQQKRVDFLVSNGYLFNEKTQSVDGTAWASVTGDSKNNFAKRLLQGNFVPPNTTLIKKSVFDVVGVFDTSLKGVDDYDMWYRIARVFPADILNKPLATWRYNNSASISANDSVMIEDELHFYEKIISGKTGLLERNQLSEWQSAEVESAKQGQHRCLQRLAHRALAQGDITQAIKLYEQAGSNKLAQLTKRAPRMARLGYRMKRLLDRVRQREFKPLILDFN